MTREERLFRAADELSENALALIADILRKHDVAVIKASVDAVKEAVAAEREACACYCLIVAKDAPTDKEAQMAYSCAASIRGRSK